MSEINLFAPRQIPAEWVVEWEGSLWIVPARAGGWDARRPYRGSPKSLQPAPAWHAMGVGLPGLVHPSVGGRVAAMREAAGLSQYELAEAAGITRQALRNVEDGSSAPSLETARKLCEALGVSLSVFDAPPPA